MVKPSHTGAAALPGPAVAGAVALVGVLASLAGFLTTGAAARLTLLSPLAFAVLAWLAARRKRKVPLAAALTALVLSIGLAVRVVVMPQAISFWYDGRAADTSEIPLAEPGVVPLTDDPVTGEIDGTPGIHLDPSGAGEIQVACTFQGEISSNGVATEIEWAQVVGGKFESRWIPAAFLDALAPGPARSLLPCTDWRWQLQSPGIK